MVQVGYHLAKSSPMLLQWTLLSWGSQEMEQNGRVLSHPWIVNINLHHRWTSSICYREALTWVRWPSYAWAMGPLRPVNPSSQTVCCKDVCIMHVMMCVFSVRHLAITTSCKCRGQIKTKAIDVHLFHPVASCTGIGGSGISWIIVIHCDACSYSSVLCIVSGS